MTEMAEVHSETTRQSIEDVQVQAETATVSLLEENVQGGTVVSHTIEAIEVPDFEGFCDFDLDLGCLSMPPSPVASTSELRLSTPSPSSSPRSSLSVSNASHTQAHNPKSSSPQLAPIATSSAMMSGSWPLVKYVGRGTPIDRSRRFEWGGFQGEEAGEDGLLFSGIRSTSLDSTRLRSSVDSQRSVSPDWNLVAPSSSLGHRPSRLHARSSYSKPRPVVEEPLPETAKIQLEGLGTDSAKEWESVMQSVLSSGSESEKPKEPPSDTPVDPGIEDSPSDEPDPAPESKLNEADDNDDTLVVSPEELSKLENGLEINLKLGSHSALDLELGQRGGINWYNSSLRPASPSGRESPSLYSAQSHSPPQSRPQSVVEESEDVSGSDNRSNRSTTSTKADVSPAPKSKGSQPWWRHVLRRFRRIHLMLRSHRSGI